MIDVLILTHNNMRTLPDCLNSIAQHTKEKYRIYVLDNASTDQKFLDYLQKVKNAIVINGDINIGVGPGRRRLSDMSTADFVMFLDSDMLVTEKWDYYMLRQFDRFPLAAAISAKFRRGDTAVTHANGGSYQVVDNYIILTHHHHGLPIDDIRTYENINCKWLPGGVMMIPKHINKEIQYSHRHYKIGFEDIDFSFKLKKAGYELYNCPYTDFYHLSKAKDEDYDKIRMDRVELLKSVAVFTNRWKLNPIKSWKTHHLIVDENVTNEEITELLKSINNNMNNNKKIAKILDSLRELHLSNREEEQEEE